LFPAVYTLLIFFGILIISFIDKKRKYANLLIVLAIVNVIIMVTAYFYKHFLH
jgi:hypothetical protein